MALGINDEGMIIGRARTPDGRWHAFVWKEGEGMRDLTPDAQCSFASGVNNAGQIAGEGATAEQEGWAFLWEEATGVVELGFAGSPSHLSSSGEISGMCVGQNDELRLFVWTKDDGVKYLGRTYDREEYRGVYFSDFGSVAGTTWSAGLWIRDYQITEGSLRPWLYRRGKGYERLNRLVPREMKQFVVRGMNRRGEILVLEHDDGPFSSSRIALLRPIQRAD